MPEVGQAVTGQTRPYKWQLDKASHGRGFAKRNARLAKPRRALDAQGMRKSDGVILCRFSSSEAAYKAEAGSQRQTRNSNNKLPHLEFKIKVPQNAPAQLGEPASCEAGSCFRTPYEETDSVSSDRLKVSCV